MLRVSRFVGKQHRLGKGMHRCSETACGVQVCIPASSCLARRPLVEERIRERRRLRSTNSLPEISDLHRK